jgi:hypothetical protein
VLITIPPPTTRQIVHGPHDSGVRIAGAIDGNSAILHVYQEKSLVSPYHYPSREVVHGEYGSHIGIADGIDGDRPIHHARQKQSVGNPDQNPATRKIAHREHAAGINSVGFGNTSDAILRPARLRRSHH